MAKLSKDDLAAFQRFLVDTQGKTLKTAYAYRAAISSAVNKYAGGPENIEALEAHLRGVLAKAPPRCTFICSAWKAFQVFWFGYKGERLSDLRVTGRISSDLPAVPVLHLREALPMLPDEVFVTLPWRAVREVGGGRLAIFVSTPTPSNLHAGMTYPLPVGIAPMLRALQQWGFPGATPQVTSPMFPAKPHGAEPIDAGELKRLLRKGRAELELPNKVNTAPQFETQEEAEALGDTTFGHGYDPADPFAHLNVQPRVPSAPPPPRAPVPPPPPMPDWMTAPEETLKLTPEQKQLRQLYRTFPSESTQEPSGPNTVPTGGLVTWGFDDVT